jgi:Lrp/AsnC family leucine-responsive transcriptional regulator
MELDALNWSILRCLQQNARMPYAEIGRQVGLSAPAVAERMQRMEDAGIIQAYRVELNPARLGRPLQAFITLKIHRGNLPVFLKALPDIEAIQECHRLTGNDCLLMKVAVTDALALESLINLLMEYGDPTTSILLSSPVPYRSFNPPAE